MASRSCRSSLAAVLLAACASRLRRGSSVAIDPQLGGDTTREVVGRNAFGFPAPELTNDERRLFEIGDSFFTQNWVTAPASTDARDGLGPMFNAQSCSSCHLLDGRGTPAVDRFEASSGCSCDCRSRAPTSTAAPLEHPVYGGQLQDRANARRPDRRRADDHLHRATGGVRRRHAVLAARPDLLDRVAELRSARRRPTRVAAARPAGDRDGIARVGAGVDDRRRSPIPTTPTATASPVASEPGLEPAHASRPSSAASGGRPTCPRVEAQAAGAFHGDIGITSALHPDQDCTADADRLRRRAQRRRTGAHRRAPGSRHLLRPDAGGAGDARHRLGRCRGRGGGVRASSAAPSCHTPTLTTGDAATSPRDARRSDDPSLHRPVAARHGRRSRPTAAPTSTASGTEWRTPPLWGLGLIEEINGRRFLLHDGRARTLEEAILWHGGEAEPAREMFRTADAETRRRLLAFLEAL